MWTRLEMAVGEVLLRSKPPPRDLITARVSQLHFIWQLVTNYSKLDRCYCHILAPSDGCRICKLVETQQQVV